MRSNIDEVKQNGTAPIRQRNLPQEEQQAGDAVSEASGSLTNSCGHGTRSEKKPSPEDVRAYMHEGQAPVDLLDPISHEVLRAPVRMHHGGIGYSRNKLLRWLATRGGAPVDLMTGLPPTQGHALLATDLADQVDRLRDAAERVWSSRGDVERAFATRWLRAYCRVLEKRPLSLTVAGIAVADAVQRARLSGAAAEILGRSGSDPLLFLHLLDETKTRAVVREGRLTLIDARGRVLVDDSAVLRRRVVQAATIATLGICIGLRAAHPYLPAAPIVRIKPDAMRVGAELMTALTAAMAGATETILMAPEGNDKWLQVICRCLCEALAFWGAGYALGGPDSANVLGLLPYLAGILGALQLRADGRHNRHRQLLEAAATFDGVAAGPHQVGN